jgi:hypothetical protein
VRRVDRDGTISTVAGTSELGSAGDGGPATSAQLETPGSIASAPDGGFYVVDGFASERLRRIRADGTIETIAGGGRRAGSDADGHPATDARLAPLGGIARMRSDTLLVSDGYSNRIRRIETDGRLSTIAGVGRGGPYGGPPMGDGGAATNAVLDLPGALSPLRHGGFLLSDTKNGIVRGVSPQGRIETVVGDARRFQRTVVRSAQSPGYLRRGDGRDALSALLLAPGAVAALPDRDLLVVDQSLQAVRLVAGSRTKRLAVAVVGVNIVDGKLRGVTYRTSLPARGALRIRSHGQTLHAQSTGVFRGAHMTRLSRSLGPGRYRILLVVRAEGGRAASTCVDIAVP